MSADKNPVELNLYVRDILPQKYPFLFIDKIISIDRENKSISCVKNVSGNESYFSGHFPGNPIMPGVIIIEAMAQTSILLYAALKPENMAKNPVFFLGKVETSFKKPVIPGDTLILKAISEKIIDFGGIVKVIALVSGVTVAESTLSFGVKIE